MSKKRRIGAILLTIGLAFSLTTSAFASQTTQEESTSLHSLVTDSEIKEIKANFTKLGIDEATQQKLIQKLKDGKEIDAMSPDQADKGITTTVNNLATAKTSEQSAAGYLSRTVYPDGSVSVLSVTPGSGTVCGSGYCNVRDAVVDGGNGVVSASFLADYTIVNGGYGSISNAYQPKIKIYAGSYSNVTGPTIVRGTETYYQSARASMSWQYTNPAGNSLQYLHLDVQNNSASSTFQP